jgi:cation:H+ antiporter
MPDVSALPGWLLAPLFAAAAAAVWAAGVRLASATDEVAARTGLRRRLSRRLLLGGVTSLPEGASTVTAAAIGNAPLRSATSSAASRSK